MYGSQSESNRIQNMTHDELCLLRKIHDCLNSSIALMGYGRLTLPHLEYCDYGLNGLKQEIFAWLADNTKYSM